MSMSINNEITNTIWEKLLTIKIPDQFICDTNQKLVTGLTWKDIFTYIESEHWHQCGNFTCPHSESLYEHLLRCANICYNEAIIWGHSKRICVKAYLTGLLHDIGKPGTRRILGKHTAFKGHGLVGGAILENFYTEELGDAFDLAKEDWADISTCADVHMCSYFPQQTSLLHKYSVNILPIQVKNMLFILRTGDQLGLTPIDSYGKTTNDIKNDVISGEHEYRKTLFSEIPFSTLDKKKGILILVQGGSSTGKSTFSLNLVNHFGTDKCVHINRDWYMVHWSQKMTGINDKIGHITPTLYQTCYKKYIDSGKKWAPQINNHMMNDIHDGLQQGKIVIVDTLATMFDAIEGIIPEIATNAYRISFWLHRNELITETETMGRLGMELSAQLSAHGVTSLYNPYNKNINWMKMISATEGDEDSPYQSHLSISVGWTGIKQSIINHLLDKILEMYEYNQTLPRVPVLDQTYDLTLVELVQKLKDLNSLEDFFKQYAYTVSKHIPGAVGIKYIDGINQIWRPKWAREARGRFYYVVDNKVISLKDTLQRGIEILTKAHLEAGIDETQDVSIKTNDHFDDTQQIILNTFSAVNPIDSYLTGKVDGSLLIVNIYPIESDQYAIIKNLGLSFGDSFTKTIINYCVDNNYPILTVSSQGTLFLGPDMQDYFLTSIQTLMDTVVTSMDDWTTIVPNFIAKFLDYYQSIGLNNKEMVNICFESYCKNRLTFNGKLHTELAVGYDHNGLNLLGLMNKGIYIPHFDLPRRIFTQPFYYRIKNTTDVYRLMNELDEVVLGTRTTDQFLTNFLLDEFTSRVVHPEGFVLLTPMNGTYDYAKIKTQMYYKCHKVREGKIKELLDLPDCCSGYYPILKNLHSFFDNMETNIKSLIMRTYESLRSEIKMDSVFYLKLNPKAQLRMESVIDAGTFSDVVFKMMLNNKNNSSDLVSLFSPITQDLYENTTEEMIHFTKCLLMKVEPWSLNWETRLNYLLETHDESVSSLYGIIIGFNN